MTPFLRQMLFTVNYSKNELNESIVCDNLDTY